MKRIGTGIGHQAQVQLKPDSEGNLGEAAILRLANAVNGLIERMNGNLRLGNGSANSEAGNLSGIWLRLVFPSADTEIVVPHDLGRVPVGFIPLFLDRACIVYSVRGAAEAWGDGDKAYFACDTINAKVIGILF